MASVLCDPNYDPNLYRDIEALLFLYDQVCLYSPSQAHIQMAGHDWKRLKSLIEHGFVIPVGRGFWFNPAERAKLCTKYAANPEKVATYRWSQLDDRILGLGRATLSADGSWSPGYFAVSDDHRDFAEEMERRAARSNPTAFAALMKRATELSARRLLPVELMTGDFIGAPPDTIAAKLVFYTAGDLRVADSLSVASVFSTPQMGGVYEAVARWLWHPPHMSTPRSLAVVDPSKEYLLTPEEVRIAAELARQIVDDDRVGPLNLDLLLEYRKTECSRLFRDFVSHELHRAPPPSDPDLPPESRLKAIFDEQAAWVDALADYGPWVGGITVGGAGGLWVDAKLEKHSLTRRSFLTVVAALSFGAFSDKLAPSIANRIVPSIVARRYDTLFAIVRRQRQRR